MALKHVYQKQKQMVPIPRDQTNTSPLRTLVQIYRELPGLHNYKFSFSYRCAEEDNIFDNIVNFIK